METITVNVTRVQARREQLHGRDYLVVPATLIVPGVLNGSRGALYYPPDEIQKNPDAWNGMPIVVYHPTRNGKHVSARRPDILRDSGIGVVYGSRAKGKLSAEAWFDVEATRNYDKKLSPEYQILPRLESGGQIELSTGLFTDNEPAPKGSVDNKGRPYQYTARNYKPDHLAVLPDQVGACSIQDGCGIAVNSRVLTPLPDLWWEELEAAYWGDYGWQPIGNAFDESKIVRGPGGKFGDKPDMPTPGPSLLETAIKLQATKKGKEKEFAEAKVKLTAEEKAKQKMLKQSGVADFLSKYPELAEDFEGMEKRPAGSHWKYAVPTGEQGPFGPYMEQFTLTGKSPRAVGPIRFPPVAGQDSYQAMSSGIKTAVLDRIKPGSTVQLMTPDGQMREPGDENLPTHFANRPRIVEGKITGVTRDEMGKITGYTVKGQSRIDGMATRGGYPGSFVKKEWTIPISQDWNSISTGASKDHDEEKPPPLLNTEWVPIGNAFDESKIVRGPGGKFGDKPDLPTAGPSLLETAIKLQASKKDGEEQAEQGQEQRSGELATVKVSYASPSGKVAASATKMIEDVGVRAATEQLLAESAGDANAERFVADAAINYVEAQTNAKAIKTQFQAEFDSYMRRGVTGFNLQNLTNYKAQLDALANDHAFVGPATGLMQAIRSIVSFSESRGQISPRSDAETARYTKESTKANKTADKLLSSWAKKRAKFTKTMDGVTGNAEWEPLDCPSYSPSISGHSRVTGLQDWTAGKQDWATNAVQVASSQETDEGTRLQETPLVANSLTEVDNYDRSLNDRMSDLSGALRERFGSDAYMLEMYDDYVVFSREGKTYRLGYTEDEGTCELSDGKPKEVKRLTQYEVIENSGGRMFPLSNSTTPTIRGGRNMAALTTNQRSEIITHLTTNCECWKHAGDKEILAAFSDEKLTQLKSAADKEQQAYDVANAAVNGFQDGQGNAFRINPETGKWEKGKVPVKKPVLNAGPEDEEEEEDDDEEEEEAPAARNRGKGKGTRNKVKEEEEPRRRRPQTIDQVIRTLPEHLQKTIRNAQEVETREKVQIINQLLVNVAAADRPAQQERLMNRDLEDLRMDLSMLPKQLTQEEIDRASQTSNRRRRDEDDGDVLGLPSVDWTEVDEHGDPVNNSVSNTTRTPAQETRTRGEEDMSDEEWLRNAPASVRNKFQAVAAIEKREREGLIDDLIANFQGTEEQERRLVSRLNKMGLEELRDMQALQPKKEQRRNYFGGGPITPSTVTNRSSGGVSDTDDVLPLPTMDWSEGQQRKARG
jgi:hypothetical protein